MILLVIVLLLAAFLLYKHFYWKAEAWPEGALQVPTYQGHRGYWPGGSQENTMQSFRAAKLRGLEMIEMDVRLSKDLVPVIFHDDNLQRIGGRPEKVSEFTAAELAELVQACSFEEILTATDIPQKLNVELKTPHAKDSLLEEKVAALIRQHRAENRVLISSFNPLALKRIGKLLPQVPRSLLATKENDPSNRFYLKYLLFAPYIQVQALHLDYRYVSLEQLKAYRRRNIPVAFWTVNEKEKAQELLAAGAFSIISDQLSN